jgi:hypothetical protein
LEKTPPCFLKTLQKGMQIQSFGSEKKTLNLNKKKNSFLILRESKTLGLDLKGPKPYKPQSDWVRGRSRNSFFFNGQIS